MSSIPYSESEIANDVLASVRTVHITSDRQREKELLRLSKLWRPAA